MIQKTISLFVLSILMANSNIIFVNASITGIGTSESREVTFISEFTLYDGKIIGNPDNQYSGILITTIVVNTFNESFKIIIDSIDFKLLNSEMRDVVASLWLYNDTNDFSLSSSFPNYIISVPIQFTPRLLSEDTNLIITVTVKGSYSGFLLNGEFTSVSGVLATFRYDSNIKFYADVIIADPYVIVSDSTWIILISSILIIIIFLVRYVTNDPNRIRS